MAVRDYLGCDIRVRANCIRKLMGVAMLAWGTLWLASGGRAADYVIHISVDGLRPDYLQAVINAGHAPNFKRFETEGAWTTNARADYSYTITLPNHTTMLTGRPVTQPDGLPDTIHHGLTINFDPGEGSTLHNQGNPNIAYKASTFDVAHDAGLSTALYASKSKFAIFDRSYNETSGAPNVHGADKIDKYFSIVDGEPFYAQTMQNELLADLAENPARYNFVHYANTDTAGHTYGWGGEAYNNAIVSVDGYLGGVFDAIQANPALAGRTAIILSADHGGEGYDHQYETLAVDYTIPFFVWGEGVAHGDLYALNGGTRADPGTLRPTYTEAGQPIRNGDGGNLALNLLGLGPIPGSFINAAQNLRVTAPGPILGDFNGDHIVNAADYVAWRKGLDVTYTLGEYMDWRFHFGQIASSGASFDAAEFGVPEPIVAWSAALSGILLTFVRSRPSFRGQRI